MEIGDGLPVHEPFLGQVLGDPVTADEDEAKGAEEDDLIPLFHGRCFMRPRCFRGVVE